MYTFLWTDTHFGVKSDSKTFHDYQKKVFDDLIFPELLRNRDKIDKIIHLGDFFDKRKQVNFITLQFVKTHILDKLKTLDIPMDIIVGNHDCTFKNTNELNSPEQLLISEYPFIKVYKSATEVDGILYVPWINPENEKETVDIIRNSSCKILMGHLELLGFTMFKGAISDHGLKSDLFFNYDIVFSGHFHTKSNSENIHYLGCPWDLIFTDAHEIKGVHFFDTNTLKLEYVQNPYKIFNTLYYDDTHATTAQDVLLSDNAYKNLRDTYVKVYIKAKKNAVFFDRYCDKLNECSAASLMFVEEYPDLQNDESIEVAFTDTLDMIEKCIDDYAEILAAKDKKDQLTSLIKKLYIDAAKEEE